MSSAVATVVLAAIPSPDRGVWYLGPVPIRAYALCIIAGIIVAVLWGERRFVARGGEAGVVTDVAVFAVPFGLVGGRLYHVATDWETYFGPNGDPIDAFKIWQGGLGIWGAVALGAVGAWIGCHRRGVPLPFFADAVAPGIVTAQAIGRIGNWFNQELYGGPTTLPWGLEIYRRVNPDTGAPDGLTGVALDHTPIETVHPTFLYELLWNLVVAAVVVWADRRFKLGHGRAFAVYVAGYTAGRFWIEQMRSDYATRVFGDLRINVVVSAVVFVAAVLYLVLVRQPREVLPPVEQVDADADDDAARVGEKVSVGAGAVSGRAAAPASRVAAAPLADPVEQAPPAESDSDGVASGGSGADTSVAKESAASASVAGQPAASESSTAESPTAESPTAESPAAESVAAESVAEGSQAAESPALESPAAESPAVESPAAESPGAESPTRKPASQESAGDTPADVALDGGPAEPDPAAQLGSSERVDTSKPDQSDSNPDAAEPGDRRP